MFSTNLQLLILAVLIILSGFFSGSETAVLAVSRLKVRNLIEKGNRRAVRLNRLLDRQNKVLASVLVGNNAVNIAASALATSLAISYWGSDSVGAVTLIMTVTILIFGEVFPKTLASARSEWVSLRIVPVLELLMLVLSPVVRVLTGITNVLLRVFGGDAHGSRLITEEEIRTLVTVGQEEGVLEAEEREMIHSIFEFTDTLVREVMVPRTDMTVIASDINYGQLVDVILKTQFSRLPVIRNSIDDIIGILYVKDLFALGDEEKRDFDVTRYMREPYFIPDSKNVRDLFNEFLQQHLHIAIVVDEYGGTAGLVTLEDLIEEITGEILDEYDVEENLIEEIGPGSYSVDAAMEVEDVNAALGLDLPYLDYRTIGGLVLDRLGHIPQEGERFNFAEVSIQVEKVTGKRLRRVRIITSGRGDAE